MFIMDSSEPNGTDLKSPFFLLDMYLASVSLICNLRYFPFFAGLGKCTDFALWQRTIFYVGTYVLPVFQFTK